MPAAAGADGAGAGIAKDGAVVVISGEAGWRGLRRRRRVVFRVAVERVIAIVAAQGDLSRRRGEKGFLAGSGRGGEFGGLDIKLDA